MKNTDAAIVSTFLAAAVLLPSCIFSHAEEECLRDGTCGPYDGSGLVGGSGGTGGGGDGGGGGTPVECIPSQANGPVDDSCGVFVATSGNDEAAGTKTAPLATIAQAITKAGSGAIYLCGESFSGAVELPAGKSVYGGLDCSSNWSYEAGKRTELTSDADTVPLKITGSGSSTVADIDITSANASGNTGQSSIAVLVSKATVSFERCNITAGMGAPGAPGETPSDVLVQSIVGNPGNAGCTSTAVVLGGSGPTVDCNDGMSSTGGAGGISQSNQDGGDGSNGNSSPPVSSPAVNKGTGQLGVVGNSTPCKNGENGSNGDPGSDGVGAIGLGTLSTTGYSAPLATGGQGRGTPGQGGGGGGSAKGSIVCTNNTYAGHSGGSGGTGGCGGFPGTAGGPGGSSIALLSFTATISLSFCSLSASSGGTGGQGGDGQSGSAGQGGGNNGGTGACLGGFGGVGGRGGSGGGGLGGHSLAIAWLSGTAPAFTTDITLVAAEPGNGGDGGDGNTDIAGGAGQSCKILDFESETCSND